MNPKTICALAAVSAAALNVPAHAQVKAAFTRDVDRPTAQPVNGSCNSNFFSAYKCTLYAVPAGKRLVVETISYELTSLGGGLVYSLVFGQDAPSGTLGLGTTPNVYGVAAVSSYSGSSTVNSWRGTQPLRIYLDEGQALAAQTFSTGSSAQNYAFSGYLVDK